MIFSKADILLPKNADMKKWAVVACDQYTSEPLYWEEADKIAGDAPSAMRLILPEVYLEADDVSERISSLNKNMQKYLDDGVFESTGKCFIYVERTLNNGSVRKGIVGAIDLEEYDYSKGSTSKVRATEMTVVERIPPRLKVRENACVELPHIMILADNPEKDIIEEVGRRKDSFQKLYDFDLMMNSGHITGYKIDEDTSRYLEEKLDALDDTELFNSRYGLNEKTPLVYAMGDGNHSLATAKEYYNKVKDKVIDGDVNLARYALCELVNLHDESLEFEAIHRVVFDVDCAMFENALKEVAKIGEGEQSFVLVHNGEETVWHITNPTANITVGSIQNFIDEYLKTQKGKVDYIHGEDVVRELSCGENYGIILDAMDKNDLFKTVAIDGALPRKTFSMGEACDKRFYVEARLIKG